MPGEARGEPCGRMKLKGHRPRRLEHAAPAARCWRGHALSECRGRLLCSALRPWWRADVRGSWGRFLTPFSVEARRQCRECKYARYAKLSPQCHSAVTRSTILKHAMQPHQPSICATVPRTCVTEDVHAVPHAQATRAQHGLSLTHTECISGEYTIKHIRWQGLAQLHSRHSQCTAGSSTP